MRGKNYFKIRIRDFDQFSSCYHGSGTFFGHVCRRVFQTARICLSAHTCIFSERAIRYIHKKLTENLMTLGHVLTLWLAWAPMYGYAQNAKSKICKKAYWKPYVCESHFHNLICLSAHKWICSRSTFFVSEYQDPNSNMGVLKVCIKNDTKNQHFQEIMLIYIWETELEIFSIFW